MRRLLVMLGIAWSLSAAVGPSYAQEPTPTYSLLALERVSVAAQVGYRWEGLVHGLSGVDPVPVIRIAPVYALYGKPGKSQGSVALAFPVAIGLNTENRVDFGVMLSFMILEVI
jgi:hypothetical protein